MKFYNEWLQKIIDNVYRATIVDHRYIGYFKGIGITLLVSFFAVLLGVAIGIIIAIVKYSFSKKKNAVLAGERKGLSYFLLAIIDKVCSLYLTIIRGTPVLLQLLIIGT